MARRPRGKVNVAFIADPKKRKDSYRSRKNGLLKKTEEIAMLTGVKACLIINNEEVNDTVVWPNPTEAWLVAQQSKTFFGREEKMHNPMSYINYRIQKQKKRLEKLESDNKKKEMAIQMYQFLDAGYIPDMSLEDLTLLEQVINETMREMKNDLNTMQNGAGTSAERNFNA